MDEKQELVEYLCTNFDTGKLAEDVYKKERGLDWMEKDLNRRPNRPIRAPIRSLDFSKKSWD